jgi:predicted nucleic acid-binding protein
MLLDTSGLYCCVDADDTRHEEAVTLFDAAPRRVTHNYVLAEFVPLAVARGYPRAQAVAFAAAILEDPEIDPLWGAPDLHRAAMSLLQSQLDKRYSLWDAISFLIMRATGITESLTTDRHFEQAGFVRLLKP